MTAMAAEPLSFSPATANARAHNEGGCFLAVRNSHDLAAAVCYSPAERLAQEALHLRGGVGGIPGDFGNHCVCEAAGVCLHDLHADHVPALHEVIVVGHDGALMPRRGGAGRGCEGGEDEREAHFFDAAR